MRIKDSGFPPSQRARKINSSSLFTLVHPAVLLPAGMALSLAACGGGGGGANGGEPPPRGNQAPVPVAGCSTTPQRGDPLSGTLEATDGDNSANELTFSLDPDVPMVTGPIQTAKGTVELLDVTTGEFRYTPNDVGPRGADTFQFRVDDPESFAVGTETVIINPAIMPLGDSITAGTIRSTTDPARVGYRRKLFNDLTASGYTVDFVGSLSTGTTANPPIADANHEGHGGFSAAQIADNVIGWLSMNPADIVLLHAGTNTINSDNIDAVTRAAHVQEILDNIDQWEIENKNPITVFVAQIIDRSNEDGSFPNPRVDEFNSTLLDMVAGRTDDDIVVADQHSALIYPSDMTLHDQDDVFIHPNQAGYDKMATRWLESGLLDSPKLAKCE